MQVQVQTQTRFPVLDEDILYNINKGVNRPIEFKGIKAQYIYYLATGLVVLLVLFCMMYLIGTPVYLSLALILGLGTGLFTGIMRLSHRLGTHGLKKLMDRKKLPKAIRPVSEASQASVQLFRRLNENSI